MPDLPKDSPNVLRSRVKTIMHTDMQRTSPCYTTIRVTTTLFKQENFTYSYLLYASTIVVKTDSTNEAHISFGI